MNRARSFLIGVGLVAVGLWMLMPALAPLGVGALLIAASVRAEAQAQIVKALERRSRRPDADDEDVLP